MVSSILLHSSTINHLDTCLFILVLWDISRKDYNSYNKEALPPKLNRIQHNKFRHVLVLMKLLMLTRNIAFTAVPVLATN